LSEVLAGCCFIFSKYSLLKKDCYEYAFNVDANSALFSDAGGRLCR